MNYGKTLFAEFSNGKNSFLDVPLNQGLLYRGDILGRPGWTDHAINVHFDEADAYRIFPDSEYVAEMYQLTRVVAVEKTDAFKREMAKNFARQRTVVEIQTRMQNRQAIVTVMLMDSEEIIENAIDYFKRGSPKSPTCSVKPRETPPVLSEEAREHFLRKIIVSYVHDKLSNYCDHWEDLESLRNLGEWTYDFDCIFERKLYDALNYDTPENYASEIHRQCIDAIMETESSLIIASQLLQAGAHDSHSETAGNFKRAEWNHLCVTNLVDRRTQGQIKQIANLLVGSRELLALSECAFTQADLSKRKTRRGYRT